jgi:hypothetical protein
MLRGVQLGADGQTAAPILQASNDASYFIAIQI